MHIYDFKVTRNDGSEISLRDYQGKVLIIVNTASLCGFTSQFEGLEQLFKEYHPKGLEILAFPSNQFDQQEPGTDEEIQQFCKMNYGVSFPVFKKADVRGEQAQPVFSYLSEKIPFTGFDLAHPIGKGLVDFLEQDLPEYLEGNSIKWNFTKFLIDRTGNVVGRFESTTEPSDMREAIEKVL